MQNFSSSGHCLTYGVFNLRQVSTETYSLNSALLVYVSSFGEKEKDISIY